jgi:hypothetical protein
MNKAIVVAAAMFGLVISMPAGADVIGFTDGFAPGLSLALLGIGLASLYGMHRRVA